MNSGQRLVDGLPGPRCRLRHAAQIVVVGVEALGRLALGALDLRLLELWRDRADDALGHPVLQLEDVLERAVEAVGPEMGAGRRIDELAGDAHAVRGLAHAAFEHVAHAELAADLPHVDGAALVGEARIAGDHEQPANARQRGDDVLDHAVGEILLLGVAAHVLERQHGDRRLVGQRERASGWLAGPGLGRGVASRRFPFTVKAWTGRSMFFRARSPRSANVALSRPVTAS